MPFRAGKEQSQSDFLRFLHHSKEALGHAVLGCDRSSTGGMPEVMIERWIVFLAGKNERNPGAACVS
jgi:hypothetical protein